MHNAYIAKEHNQWQKNSVIKDSLRSFFSFADFVERALFDYARV